jgi:hypothetical protein
MSLMEVDKQVVRVSIHLLRGRCPVANVIKHFGPLFFAWIDVYKAFVFQRKVCWLNDCWSNVCCPNAGWSNICRAFVFWSNVCEGYVCQPKVIRSNVC